MSGVGGPIALTGASGRIGTALQLRLVDAGEDVRPLGRRDDLHAAFHDARVVVHLAGTLAPVWPNTLRVANLDTVEATVTALRGSQVERVVFLSVPGADPHSPNTYLWSKGKAEELLRGGGVPATILRCCHVFGPPEDPGPLLQALLTRHDDTVKVLGSGAQRWTPLFRDDVVDAIVHASTSRPAEPGTFELAGPVTMTVDELVDEINGRIVQKHHVDGVAARVAGYIVRGLSPPMVEILVDDCVVDGTPAAERFGLRLRGVRDIWSREPTAVG